MSGALLRVVQFSFLVCATLATWIIANEVGGLVRGFLRAHGRRWFGLAQSQLPNDKQEGGYWSPELGHFTLDDLKEKFTAERHSQTAELGTPVRFTMGPRHNWSVFTGDPHVGIEHDGFIRGRVSGKSDADCADALIEAMKVQV